jgi:hypothetical protein
MGAKPNPQTGEPSRGYLVVGIVTHVIHAISGAHPQGQHQHGQRHEAEARRHMI